MTNAELVAKALEQHNQASEEAVFSQARQLLSQISSHQATIKNAQASIEECKKRLNSLAVEAMTI